MNKKEKLLAESKQEFLKSLKHLKYSYNKTKDIVLSKEKLEDDEALLESFEGLASRFSRSSDIFVSRYLRTYVLIQEPGFRGSLLDYLNQAEKLGLIGSSQTWREIKEIRNSAAHEYGVGNLKTYFERLVELTQEILNLEDRLK